MSNILFIPGMMCDARLYQPQIEAFSGHHNLYLASPTKFDSMQALAADILENAPPAICFGWPLHGWDLGDGSIRPSA